MPRPIPGNHSALRPDDPGGRHGAEIGNAPSLCGFAAAALGLVVIAGWLLGIGPLKSVLPGLATMKFNTALGFLLAGAALFFRGNATARLALATAVGLLGALTLGEIFSGADFGIDQLFVRADAVAGQPPGRMSPATAVCFVLSGAALALLGRRGTERGAEALALALWAVGFVALLGYVFGARQLYNVPGFGSMALHTAAGFILLAAGALGAVPEGIVALMLHARGSGRMLRLGFGVLTALLIATGVFSARRLHGIAADVNLQSEVARPRAAATRQLEGDVLDYGLGVHGFLAGDAASRPRTAVNARNVAEGLAEYARLARTPRQRELAARFSAQWEELHAHGEALMAAGTASGGELARLAALRLALQALLEKEMLPDAVADYDARRAATLGSLSQTEGLTLLLLIGGIVVALVTSGGVMRAVLGRDATLRENSRRNSEILASTTDGFHVIDAQWRFTEFNPAARRMYAAGGMDAAAMLGMHIVEEVFPNARELPAIKALIRTMTERVATGAENFYEPWQRWFSVRHFPTPDGGAATFFQDVTEQKRADAALHESEQRLRLAMDAAEIGSWDWDMRTNEIIWSPEHEIIFGYEPGTPRRTYADFERCIHPDDTRRVESATQEAMKGGTDFICEFRVVWPDGSVHWVSGFGRFHFDPEGRPCRMVGMVKEITGRKQAEVALRESEQRLRLAVAGADLGTWHWDIRTGELVWSERCLAMFGIPPGTVMSFEIFLASLHADDRARADAAVQRALWEHVDYDIEFRSVWPDGSMHWASSKGHVSRDEAGRPVRMEGVAMEITERKQAQEQIEASLREKELLLREIHHRVKNNLQIVSSLLNLQSRRLTDPAMIAVFASTRDRVRAMAAVHAQLYESRDFARINLATHLGKLARALTLTQALRPATVRPVLTLDPVMVDLNIAVPLSLIVNEVVTNALKYAFAGRSDGKLALALRAGGERHELRISDDGPGIPPGKDAEDAPTLGLRIMRDLARQIRAELEIDSSPAGTAVTLRWPANGEPATQPHATEP